ncbi:MAG: hypothetical protein JSW44_02975, partial [Candidatus Bathyarchaeota archaeon]
MGLLSHRLSKKYVDFFLRRLKSTIANTAIAIMAPANKASQVTSSPKNTLGGAGLAGGAGMGGGVGGGGNACW